MSYINIIMSKEISKFGQTFISYGSYHYDTVNKWIHIVCVPIIAATLIAAINFIPFTFNIAGYTVGPAQLFLAGLLLYYISINVTFAMGMAVLMAGLAFGWQKVFADFDGESYKKWVLIVHVVAWILQFVGHGVFEKRKPALLDNLSQILNAPLFVVVQIFDMLGIRSAEMQLWLEQVKKNVEAFRLKNKAQ